MNQRVLLLLSIAVVVLVITAGLYSLSKTPPIAKNPAVHAGQTAAAVRPSLLSSPQTSASPEQSPVRTAIAPLLDPLKVRKLSGSEVRAYLDHFGWTGPRVAAAYYLRAFPGGEEDQELFMEHLTGLVHSDPAAALVVAVNNDESRTIRAAQSLQRLQPGNSLGYLLEAAALLKSDATYAEVKDLIDSALDGRTPDLLIEERSDHIREAYEFHGMSPDAALAHTFYFSHVSFEPASSIRNLASKLAEISPLAPIDQASTQIAFSQMLEFVYEGARGLPYNTYPMEATMNMSELTALRKLPHDTYYGAADYTVGQRIADLTAQMKSHLELYSVLETRLRQASDEQLQTFFGVWHTDGFRAAMESVTDEGQGDSTE
jgi:hypothetical protein